MGYVFGEDQRGRGGCYELTGKWQRGCLDKNRELIPKRRMEL